MNSLARQGTLRDVQIISPLSKHISVEWEKTSQRGGGRVDEIPNGCASPCKKSVALIPLLLTGVCILFLRSILIVFKSVSVETRSC